MVASTQSDRQLRRDLRTLVRFVQVYCHHQHPDAPRRPVRFKTHDVVDLNRGPLELCDTCRRLLAHSLVKRSNCPLEPKPACKKCPSHCYQPAYRKQIREVMKFSGRRLVLAGRLDYLFHLIF